MIWITEEERDEYERLAVYAERAEPLVKAAARFRNALVDFTGEGKDQARVEESAADLCEAVQPFLAAEGK